jgi:hypothetical protein
MSKRLAVVVALALALSSLGCGLNHAAAGAGAAEGLHGARRSSRTETCLSKFEDVASGLNKICLYTCASGDAAFTVHAAELCPLTIER